MRTEPPAQRLHRRFGVEPGADSDGDETDDDQDPNAVLPRWLPDGSADDEGWLAKMRADPGRTGAIALAVIAVVAVLVTLFTVVRDRPAPVASAQLPPVEMASSNPSASPSAKAEQPVVSVVGLVHAPGLVTLAPGARIADALTAAGGVLDGSDTVGLNMARQVADGEQIVVGIAPRLGQPTALGSSVGSGSGSGADSAAPQTTSQRSEPTTAQPSKPIDLNTATVGQLDALPGVGPVTASAIVAWRDSHGKFTSVEQLGEVDGIGPARLDKLRALVRV
jgi:competence protein ComEA